MKYEFSQCNASGKLQPVNPDLSGFKAHGGKMIQYAGGRMPPSRLRTGSIITAR
jgi:hypothetical protein